MIFSSLNFISQPNPGDKALKIKYANGQLAHIVRDSTCTIKQSGVNIFVKQQSESNTITLTFASDDEAKIAHILLRQALIRLGNTSAVIGSLTPLEYIFNPPLNTTLGITASFNIPIIVDTVYAVYVNGAFVNTNYYSLQTNVNGIETVFTWESNALYTLNTTDVVTIIYSRLGYLVNSSNSSISQLLTLSASNTSEAALSFTFSNSNNVSFGLSNGVITASINNVGGGMLTLSASNSSQATDAITFSNSNNVSFGLSNGVITASIVSQSNPNISLYGLGNTTQNSSTILNVSNLSFNALGSLTVGFSNGSIQLSAPNALTSQTIQTQNSVQLQGSTGNISFSNSNGITFGFNASTITASHNGLTSQSNQAFSAQGGSSAFQTLNFANSNGITFSNSNGSIVASHNGITTQTVDTNKAGTGFTSAGNNIGLSGTLNTDGLSLSATVAAQSNPNISLFALGNTTQNSSTVRNVSNLSFNGLGNITVGYSNGSIQLSGSQSVQTQNLVSVQGSTGNISFSNSNGITFGFNASTITASHNGITSQTNQNISLFALGNTTQNSSTVLNASNLSFNGLGDITVGYSNGSIQLSGSQSVDTRKAGTGFTSAGNNIGLSGTLNTNGLSLSATVAAQSNQNISLFALGNTTQNSSTVLNASNLSFNAIGSLTVGYSNGSIQLSAPNALTSQSNQAVSGSNGSFTFQTVSFGNLNGFSFYTSNGSIVGSYNAGGANINVSAGTTSNVLTNFVLSDSNNVSFGLNGSTITASASFNQTNQTVGIYASSQTTGSISSATHDARSLSFIGAGIISIGNHSTSVGGTTTGIIISAVQTVDTNKAGTGFTSVGNNIGLSGTLNTNGLSLSATVAAQTVQPVAISGSNGSFNFSTVTFGNLNGLSFYTSNGSMVGSYTVPTQSNQNISFFGLGNTTQNSSTVLNANAVSFNAIGSLTVGYSNGSIQLSAPNALTSQTNQNISLFALGNTTQNSSTLLNASNLSFNGLGIVTVGYSNGSIQVSATQSNNNVSLFALGNTTQNSSTVRNVSNLSFNGLGIITVGYSNGSIQLSATQSADTNKAGTGFTSAGNNIGLSGTLNTNGLSLSATVPAQTNQTLGIYASSQTTGSASSATFDARSLSIIGAGIISIGNHSTSVGGTTTGLIISAVQTVQTQNMVSVNGSTGNISFANANNVTFGFNASTVTASASFNQTNQTVGLYALGNTTQNSSTTLDARSLSFNGLGDITVGYSNGSIQFSGSQSVDTRKAGTGFTSAGNNIGLSGTLNTNGLSLSATVAAQTNQNISFFALGNTTQNSSSVINANAVSFNAIGSLTVGYSNGSIQFSAPNALTTQTVQTQSRFNLTLSGNSTSGGAGYQLISSGVLSLAGGNNITISQDGNALTISGANAGGAQTAISGIIASNTTYTSGSVSFRDLNGISFATTTGQGIQITHDLQYTSNTSNITSAALHTSASRVINIIAATNNTGGGTASLSSNVSFSNANNFTFYTSAGNAIVGSFSQSADTNKAGTGFTSAGDNVSLSGTLNTNGLSLSASVSTQPTMSFFEPMAAAGLQGNVIANSTLSLGRIPIHNPITATQLMFLQHLTGSTATATSLRQSITYSVGIYTMAGSTASLLSSATQSITFNLNTNTDQVSAYGGQSGTRYRTMSIGTWNITPGDYLMGFGIMYSSTGTALTISHWARPSISLNAIPGGGNFTDFWMHGVLSASTNSMPNSIHLTNINRTGSVAQRVPYFALAGTY